MTIRGDVLRADPITRAEFTELTAPFSWTNLSPLECRLLHTIGSLEQGMKKMRDQIYDLTDGVQVTEVDIDGI